MYSIIMTMVLGGQYVGQQQSQPSNPAGNYGNQMSVAGTTSSQYQAPGGSTVQGQYPSNTSQTYTGANTSQTYPASQQSQTGYNQYMQPTGNMAVTKPMNRMQG